MRRRPTYRTWFVTGAIALSALPILTGCVKETQNGAAPPAESGAPAVSSDRVATPASVRQNLGITFVKAEKRPVRGTVRIAGVFELRPEARREYHVMLPGRIELLVRQYERVEAGRPLFYLESPDWQRMQSELVNALNDMKRSHADVAVAEATLAETQKSIQFIEQRIAGLAEAQVRQVELEADLAEKRNAIPRLEAELDAARTVFDTVHARYDVMLRTASSVTGLSRDELDPARDRHGHLQGGAPPWQSVERITFFAEAGGVVDRLPVTNQGWVETGDLVLDTVDPALLRFHADALQTDINLFADGQPARIVPPMGGSFDLQNTADGRIEVGFEAHPGQRTMPIYLPPEAPPRWAKAGVTAYLEVFIAGKDDAVTAIPESAIVRDGLDRIFFRRDPKNPDQVIRVVADLGATDNRWVEVKSGVRAGDEIVLGGVYPLTLASSTSGESQKGGHFHADGTFHEEGEH
jgi:multidrug efflux pump subunit AcrA (membrane-fusion protein)